MQKFKGTPGPWSYEAGWLKGHTSISGESHGALSQVVSEMEWEGTQMEMNMDNGYYRRWVEKNEVLQANVYLIRAAPEMLDSMQSLVSELFYQLESKFGPEMASKHPAIVEARMIIKSALGEKS